MTFNLLILFASYLLPKPLALSGHHSLFFPDLVLLKLDLADFRFEPADQGLLVAQVVAHLVVLPPRGIENVAQTVR